MRIKKELGSLFHKIGQTLAILPRREIKKKAVLALALMCGCRDESKSDTEVLSGGVMCKCVRPLRLRVKNEKQRVEGTI